MVICVERGADLHMAQLMPLPLIVSCFSKIQIGFTFLVPAQLGSPGKGPLNGCVCSGKFWLWGTVSETYVPATGELAPPHTACSHAGGGIVDAKSRVWGQFGPENKLIEGQPNEYDVICRNASVLAFHLWPTIFAGTAFHHVLAPLYPEYPQPYSQVAAAIRPLATSTAATCFIKPTYFFEILQITPGFLKCTGLL